MRPRSETSPDDEEVMGALLRIPALAADDDDLVRRGRFVDVDCLVGTPTSSIHLAIRAGRPEEAIRGPVLMRSTRFAYRATTFAWSAYWRALPEPGFHDLLALTKRGEAILEGDLHPFIANLQYFKDLLALPRRPGGGR